jgi:hypothetical protein
MDFISARHSAFVSGTIDKTAPEGIYCDGYAVTDEFMILSMKITVDAQGVKTRKLLTKHVRKSADRLLV